MTITVLQLSDMHVTADPAAAVSGEYPELRLQLVLDAWHRTGESADLLLLTGDNTDDGSPDAYTRLAATLSTLGVPILAVPGNHDTATGVGLAFGDMAVVELDGWNIVGLDTCRPNQVHGTVDIPASVELIDALDKIPTVLAIHHPPMSRSNNAWFQLDGAAALLDVLAARPHVRAVVSGHLHDAFEFKGAGGLALLGCPSTLTAIDHDGDMFTIGANTPRGARILRLEDDGTMSSSLLVA